ncbi:MAG: hypothetical protein J1E64_10120 [Acetatifactor sp.]|nr:hypothetical protein [Acetatifactor sp.]
MKKELDYFIIDGCYGGNQDWFTDWWMNKGGCGAATCCDSSLYFAIHREMTHLYPYDVKQLTKEEYIQFAMLMKPYLSPRMRGIDKLDIYIDGAAKYFADRGEPGITMLPFAGESDVADARRIVRYQIDHGYPIPYLNLKHKNKALDDYEWHWFLLTGYELFCEEAAGQQEPDGTMMVKAVTYGNWRWLDFDDLWDTGHREKGGMVLYRYTPS